ncbi:MAG: helicase-exonuclease AddAB subunit AddA [Limisphaerales bacterium]
MDPAHVQNDLLTASQQRAIAARGNVLVMAGAGTGKTHTLVERCLNCLCEENPRASLDEILVVTFTEAAAAEMHQRLRAALENSINHQPSTINHLAEQLALFDAAHIGTLHGFCFQLVREHFYELGLDPQISVLDEGQTRLLADETLEEQFNSHYEGDDAFSLAVQNLIKIYGNGRDEKIRALVLRLHNCAQTWPDADGWLAKQIEHFSSAEPVQWREWFSEAISNWRDEWLPALENLRAENPKAAECLEILEKFSGSAPASGAVWQALTPNTNTMRETKLPSALLQEAGETFSQILAADVNWPRGKKTVFRKPLEDFFDDATFLNSFVSQNKNDPLAEDWNWICGQMTALLRLTQSFSARFSARKRDDGVLDFHDLEQFALKLLWVFSADKPTQIAGRWREKLRFVFVDEYQDINAAQDKIISALSRNDNGANRFLVGDVKQSIYRFRLADPKIFRDYAKNWNGKNGQTLSLTDNFRSRENLLGFVNSVFELLMRDEIGGVNYDDGAKLKFGSPETRAALSLEKNLSPRAELLLRFKTNDVGEKNNFENESGGDDLADLQEAEKEARLLALHLNELKNARHDIWDDDERQFRAVEWRDMAVLLRAPSGKAEVYAKEFARAGIPLIVERSGFYDSSEILDLLSLLQLLDNPLRDVPAIAVLRSPIVGLSLDELAEIRLTAPGHFWFALNQVQSPKFKVQNETRMKVEKFLGQFSGWRKLARQVSLSRCLESVVAETHYADWLKSRPRGAQRHANIERFLILAQKFDQFQRRGLFRFLKFIEAQRDAEIEPEVSAVAEENAVRLMSIHQSKGLEFPVVALADLAKTFNTRVLRSEIIFDEEFGLCPCVKPPKSGRSYPSLPHWLAQKRQRREQAGEELRLLYVAMTRARDTLILTGSVTEKKWGTFFEDQSAADATREILSARNYLDWLGIWFKVQGSKFKVENAAQGEWSHLRWQIFSDEELFENYSRRSRSNEAQIKNSATLYVVSRAEPPALDENSAKKLRGILNWKYPFAAATARAAKSSVTALRREAEDLDDEAEQKFSAFSFQFSENRPRTISNRQSAIGGRQLSAEDAGTAHHKFLQYFSFENAADLKSLEAETKRLEREKVLSADECAALVLENIAAFWESEIGKKIRATAANVKRELPFTAKFSPKELAEIAGTKLSPDLENEFVVVQGIADLAVLLPQEIWLVDFKTDAIHADDLAEKIKFYGPQLKLYAFALAKIYDRPVRNRWLHFLSARRTEKI